MEPPADSGTACDPSVGDFTSAGDFIVPFYPGEIIDAIKRYHPIVIYRTEGAARAV
jgi:hypothetical protein